MQFQGNIIKDERDRRIVKSKKLSEWRLENEKKMKAKTNAKMKGKSMTKKGRKMIAAKVSRQLMEAEDTRKEEDE